jgi:hypothetical protein
MRFFFAAIDLQPDLERVEMAQNSGFAARRFVIQAKGAWSSKNRRAELVLQSVQW